MGDRGPVCEECGYDLGGIGDGTLARCPECGLESSVQRPFVLAPMPRWDAVLWRCCWPTAAAVAGMVLAIRLGGAVVMFAGPTPMLVLWVITVFAVPSSVAGSLSRRCVLRPRRGAFRMTVACVGIAANIAITLLIVWAALRI
jgi:hypothetical protein